MRHEQQSRALKVISKPRIVDRGHDRLPCACRGNEQVAMVPTLTRERDLLEQALLERFGPKLDRTEKDDRSGHRTSGFGGKGRRVIWDEIAAVPIALEDAATLSMTSGFRTRHTDVPFEAADLR